MAILPHLGSPRGCLGEVRTVCDLPLGRAGCRRVFQLPSRGCLSLDLKKAQLLSPRLLDPHPGNPLTPTSYPTTGIYSLD